MGARSTMIVVLWTAAVVQSVSAALKEDSTSSCISYLDETGPAKTVDYEYGCYTTVRNADTKTKFQLAFDHCKNPVGAHIHKWSYAGGLATDSVELRRDFTEEDNVYRQRTLTGMVYMILNFTRFTDVDEMGILVSYIDENGERFKIIRGNFSMNTDNCGWYERLSKGERVAFTFGITVILVVVVLVIAISVGIKLRTKFQHSGDIGKMSTFNGEPMFAPGRGPKKSWTGKMNEDQWEQRVPRNSDAAIVNYEVQP